MPANSHTCPSCGRPCVEPAVRLVLTGFSLAAPDAQEVFVKLTRLGATWKWTKEGGGKWEVPGASLREALALSPLLTIADVAVVPFEPPPEPTPQSDTQTAEAATTTSKQEGEAEEIIFDDSEWRAGELERKHREEALSCVESVVGSSLDQLLATAQDTLSKFRLIVGKALADTIERLVSEAVYDPPLATTNGDGHPWPLLARWPVLKALFVARSDKVALMRKALEEMNQEILNGVLDYGADAMDEALSDGVQVLATWGNDARQCLPQLVELLAHVSSTAGLGDKSALALLQTVQEIATDEDVQVIEAVIDIMDGCEDEEIRQRCAELLSAIGRLNALQHLLSYIQWTYHDGDDFLSRSFYRNFTDALEGVAQSLGGAAVPLLVGALSKKAGVAGQIAATRALARLGSVAQDALPSLHTLLGHEPGLDYEIRVALQKINPAGSPGVRPRSE